MSQGTKRSPAHLKMARNAERKGAPMTKPTAQDLRRSVTKRRRVVLLKPCFSSRTKVWYTESGSDGREEMKKRVKANAMDCVICADTRMGKHRDVCVAGRVYARRLWTPGERKDMYMHTAECIRNVNIGSNIEPISRPLEGYGPDTKDSVEISLTTMGMSNMEAAVCASSPSFRPAVSAWELPTEHMPYALSVAT